MCCSLRFRRDGVGLCAVDATCRGEGSAVLRRLCFLRRDLGLSVSQQQQVPVRSRLVERATQASVLRYAIIFKREAKNKDATQNKWARRKLAS